MAKVELPALTIREKRADYGRILRRASELAGLNRDETADALSVDKAQISRWWSGEENGQAWRYQAHPVLKQTLLVAQAEATQGAVVKMLIELERRVG
jgi:transcriptional regulator with XRE-family HTH domain